MTFEVGERRIEVPRSARYYVLGDQSKASDVWFVLHGYGQLARTFIAEFEGIAGDSRLFIAPEALSRFYAPDHSEVVASWMTREDRESEIEDYVRYLDRVYQEIKPDRSRIRILGFSQGTATASRWAAFSELRMDELILWGGGVAEDLDLDRYHDRLAAMSIRCVAGERDQMAKPDAMIARLQSAGIQATLTRFNGGHRLDRDTLRTITMEGPS